MRYRMSALGAAGLVCFLGAPALAQSSGSGAQATQAAETAQPAIELVTVTARRRPENLEKTPVAVTVLSGDTLRTQEVKSALDLQNFAPSLTVTGNLGSRDTDVFSIRGQSQPFGGADPGVQSYFAEVPFNPSGPGSYYDMANIQVLNGPQGTLFGRSTTGGAVLFQPNKPTDEFGGYVETQLGDYALREFDGALNIPIIGDRLMVRGAFDIENRDGFTQDTVITGMGTPYTEEQDNVDTEAFRFGITARPFSHFENYLVFDYLHDKNNGTGAVLTGINLNTIAGLALEYTGSPCSFPPTTPICGALANFENQMTNALAAQQAAGPRNTTSSIPEFYRRETWSAIDIATYDVTGDLHLKNIFAYLSDKQQPAFDYDGSALPLIDISNPRTWESNSIQVTEEFQVLGEALDNNIHWLAGFYHELDHPGGYSEIQQDEFGGAAGNPLFGSTDVESLSNGGTSDAVYGSATYDASNWFHGLSFTAGGRYTWDHKVATSIDCSLPQEGSSCPYPLPDTFPYAQPTLTANFHAPTWNLDVDDQVNDDTMVYAAYRRGYKSGGFNSGAFNATDFEEFKPEYLTDVELGTKNNWTVLGVPGRTNFDVYYGWYQDVQKNDLVEVEQEISSVGPTYEPEGFSALTFNAARATIKGAELQSTFIPTDWLDVNLFYSYTDASYDRFILPSAILVGLTGSQSEAGLSNLAGSAFSYTPRTKIGITPRIRLPFDSALGTPYVSASFYWQSTEWFTDLGAQQIAQYGQSPEQKDYLLANFRFDWNNFLGYPFDAGVFVNNAFDRTYEIGANSLLNLTGTSASIYAPPRMWGVELRYRFGADAQDE